MRRRLRHSFQGRISFVAILIYALIVTFIYSLFVVIPVVQEYYRMREILTAHAYEAYRDQLDYRLRKKFVEAAEKAKIEVLPGNVIIRRHRNPPKVTIEVSWRTKAKFPLVGYEEPLTLSQSFTTSLERINWNEEKEKSVFGN